MRKRQTATNLPPARMLSKEELASYLGMGLSAAITFGDDTGARRKLGKRVLYDRNVIDTYLDGLNNQ